MRKANDARRKICAALLAGSFILTSAVAWRFPSYAEENPRTAVDPALPSIDVTEDKDETAYVLLAADGTVRSVHIVNAFPVEGPGLYTDYGVYNQVTNLSDSAAAQVKNGAVTWELNGDAGRFYYEGAAVKPGELPFLLTLSYSLDGNSISAEELAGASGHVALALSVNANPKTAAYYQKNYAAQVSIPLNMEVCRNISAPEASTVITGTSMTATYMLMPGQSGEYRLEWDTEDFSLDEISMVVMDSSMDMAAMMSSVMDTDALIDGIGGLSTAMGQIIEGTRELEAGTQEMTGAGGKLKGAGNALVQGYKAIASALGQTALTQEQIDQLKSAKDQLDSLGDVAQRMRTLLGNLQDDAYLADMLESLKQQLEDALGERLDQMSPPGELILPKTDTRAWADELTQQILSLLPSDLQLTPELRRQIAETVSQAGDGLAQKVEQAVAEAVSQQTAQILTLYQDQLVGALDDVLAPPGQASDLSLEGLKAQIRAIAENLEAQLADLQAGLAGIGMLSAGLEAQREGILQLSSGMKELNSGLSAYVDGISQVVDASSALPEGVSALAQGQELIKSGLDTTKDRMDDMLNSLGKGDETLASYAAPDAGAVHSVQFVYRTEAVKSQIETAAAGQEEEKGFWDRVLDLFR